GIQQRLVNLGIDPGPIDGIFGPLTSRGIRSFQTLEGLEATGRPGPAFVKRLREVHDKQTLDGSHNEIENHAPASHDLQPAGDIDHSIADEMIDDPHAAAHIDQEPLSLSSFDEDDEP